MRSYIFLIIVLSSCFVISEKIIPVQGLTNTTGIISWLQDSYSVNSQGVIEVIDKDMSINPNEINHLSVHVWSYSDPGGIIVITNETKPGSGIFQGTVYFTDNPPSKGNKLYVNPDDFRTTGNKVTAEYIDSVSNIGTPESLEAEFYISLATPTPATPTPATPTPATPTPATPTPDSTSQWVPVVIGTTAAIAGGIGIAAKLGFLRGGGGGGGGGGNNSTPNPEPESIVNPIQSIRIEIKGGLEK